MKITDEILKEIVWESYPKPVAGGQTCGKFPTGVILKCDAAGFEIRVENYRSQIKNKELALLLFELYLSEIKAI